MKKLIASVVAIAALVGACTGDLEDKVNDLEERVAALEATVNGNVASINALVAANANMVTVSSVVKNVETNSYTVTLSNGTSFVLANGQSPVVGVIDFEGTLYWTFNGAYLLDGTAKVPAVGLTPVFKLTNNKWTVSIDGAPYVEVKTAPIEGVVCAAPVLDVEETDYEYVFTLGGQVIYVAKAGAFSIKIKTDSLAIHAGKTLTLDFEVIGGDETTHVYTEASNNSVKTEVKENALLITAPEQVVETFIVLKAVRNADGAQTAKYITISVPDYFGTTGGILISDKDSYINW